MLVIHQLGLAVLLFTLQVLFIDMMVFIAIQDRYLFTLFHNLLIG